MKTSNNKPTNYNKKVWTATTDSNSGGPYLQMYRGTGTYDTTQMSTFDMPSKVVPFLHRLLDLH